MVVLALDSGGSPCSNRTIHRPLESGCDTGQVLVSEAVPPLVMGSGIQFEDRGSRDLKGVPGRWKVFEAVA